MTETDLPLALESVTKTFAGPDGPLPVLSGVSLALGAGETLALTGESGSGKSTLLHLAAGLETPDSGAVLIDGADIAALDDAGRAAIRRERLAIVFQQFNLIPSLDVAANVAFQARLAGRHDPDWTARLLERLGLADQARKYPEVLSGGQQQRVAIARALAPRPGLVLADEPTGNLDEDTGDRVLDLMLELVAEANAALLLVTHSSRLAERAGARAHLSHGVLA
ncbi:MAG: ABC transporter ATP-binding protein [Paracoccaceae bacterium]|nr:ABC transporter ATP-binding protein [Paracoccaceae bacterium]